MINKEIYDLVLQRVSRTGDAVLRPSLSTELMLVLQALDNSPFHPWFLVAKGDLTTTENLETVPLPADFLDLVEDSKMWLYTGLTWQKLVRGYAEDIEEKFANTEPDTPVVYTIVGQDLFLGPTPDGVYNLKFKYFKSTVVPPDDTATVTNAWIKQCPDIVSLLTASRVAKYRLRNDALAKDLQTQADLLLGNLFKLNESRKHTDMDYTIAENN
jgi:hypothetical protein